jgi:hypothetical protein
MLLLFLKVILTAVAYCRAKAAFANCYRNRDMAVWWCGRLPLQPLLCVPTGKNPSCILQFVPLKPYNILVILQKSRRQLTCNIQNSFFMFSRPKVSFHNIVILFQCSGCSLRTAVTSTSGRNKVSLFSVHQSYAVKYSVVVGGECSASHLGHIIYGGKVPIST